MTVSKADPILWFLHGKLTGTYRRPDNLNIQRTLDVHIKAWLEKHVTQPIKFAAVSQNIVSYSHVPLEEAHYDY